jgi:hypothetical protein
VLEIFLFLVYVGQTELVAEQLLELLVVVDHVLLHDLETGSEKALERVHVQNGTLGVRAVCVCGGSTWLLGQQGQLAKVVALAAHLDLLGLAVLVANDPHRALLNKVHALRVLALSDDRLVLGERFREQRIGNVHSLVRTERLEQRHVLEQLLVHFSLLEGRFEHYATESDSVQGPEFARLGHDDGGRTRHVVHQGQLSKGALVLVLADFVLVDVDVVGARLDYVEVVTVVALLDDGVSDGAVTPEHGIYDALFLLGIERTEQEYERHGLHEIGAFGLCFRVHDGRLGARVLLGVVLFGGDAHAAIARVPVLRQLDHVAHVVVFVLLVSFVLFVACVFKNKIKILLNIF